MNKNFQQALEKVLKHEGGFVNHPADPGGATNKGITLATYRRYIKKKGTVDDLKALTTEQAGKVYKAQYWDKVRGDDLPSGLDYAVFDFAVNSGPSKAVKELQKALGVTQDGIIGPITLEAARAANTKFLIDRLCDNRLAFLKRLKTWPTFGKGWDRRVTEVRAASKLMVEAPRDVPTPQPKPEVPANNSLLRSIMTILKFIFGGKK
jgi:lysozyme family protein